MPNIISKRTPSPRFAGALISIALAMGLAACGDDSVETTATDVAEATEVTIEHYSGSDTVPTNPETVVVMDTGVLLTMDALGIGADAFGSLGVPVPDEFNAVTDNPDLEAVGTAFEPDYEAINALEPDLIIVATRSSATYAEMSKIAPTVDLTLAEDVDYLTAFRARHEALGQIFDVSDEVEAQLAELTAAIDELSAQTADAGSALIVLTSGNEVSAYGPGSRFGFLHDVFGYAASDESLERDATHGDVVSFEFISEAAPDALFVVDRSAAIGEDGAVAAQVLENDLVTSTPAWQNDRVVYVDGFSWYIAGDSIPAMYSIIDDIRSSLP